MKIIAAPDSFKGSLSALQVAEAIRRGILKVDLDAEVVLLPIADGGEGTLDAILAATSGSRLTKKVSGPLGYPITASFGLLLDCETAIIEMAEAAGLNLVPQNLRDPRLTSTFGVGELIFAAVQTGAGKIVIGIGGSSTNDGGAGAMQALGARFLDDEGKSIGNPICGRDLAKLKHIDLSEFQFPVGAVQVTVASDVTNPLVGPNGASVVYGPQKGATAEIVQELELALINFADVVERDIGVSIANLRGAGAAGGLGGGLIAFLNAELTSGINLVLDTIGFDDHLLDADFVFTGEGRIDGQTLSGKAISGLLERCRPFNVPVIAFAGSIDLVAETELIKRGLAATAPIVDRGMTLEEAVNNASSLVEAAAARTMRLIKATK